MREIIYLTSEYLHNNNVFLISDDYMQQDSYDFARDYRNDMDEMVYGGGDRSRPSGPGRSSTTLGNGNYRSQFSNDIVMKPSEKRPDRSISSPLMNRKMPNPSNKFLMSMAKQTGEIGRKSLQGEFDPYALNANDEGTGTNFEDALGYYP